MSGTTSPLPPPREPLQVPASQRVRFPKIDASCPSRSGRGPGEGCPEDTATGLARRRGFIGGAVRWPVSIHSRTVASRPLPNYGPADGFPHLRRLGGSHLSHIDHNGPCAQCRWLLPRHAELRDTLFPVRKAHVMPARERLRERARSVATPSTAARRAADLARRRFPDTAAILTGRRLPCWRCETLAKPAGSRFQMTVLRGSAVRMHVLPDVRRLNAGRLPELWRRARGSPAPSVLTRRRRTVMRRSLARSNPFSGTKTLRSRRRGRPPGPSGRSTNRHRERQ